MIALGIDAGASSTRWVLLRDGAKLAHGAAPPMTGHLFDAGAIKAMDEAVARLWADVARSGRPNRVLAGITGLAAHSKAAGLYRQRLALACGLDQRRVRVVNDMEIAYRAAFAPGEGILVYAGTGSIACHLRADGTAERAGGHGYLIDDAGGGFWIGQQALRVVMRARDEQRRRSSLDRRICAEIECASWDELRAYVYGGGRAAVATLTHPAAKAAHKDDDRAAQDIFRAAGRELARLARVLLERVGDKPVALAGGVTAASPLVFEAFVGSLPPGIAAREIDPDAALVAAQLAATPSGAPSRNSPDTPRRSAT
jgi:N-acetylglucosamine kinase-like BadF-type ATPase